jgi:hypothetical protein
MRRGLSGPGSKLRGNQAEYGRKEGNESGGKGATHLDDGALQRADFSPHLTNVLIDSREAGVDSIGEVVKA